MVAKITSSVNWVVNPICRSIVLENPHLPLALVRFYQQGAGRTVGWVRGISHHSSPPQKRCWDAGSWMLCLSFKPGSLVKENDLAGFPLRAPIQHYLKVVMEHTSIKKET